MEMDLGHYLYTGPLRIAIILTLDCTVVWAVEPPLTDRWSSR